MVGVGQHVADDGEPRLARDDVGAGRGHEPAVDADAVVHALGDRGRRQPGREAQLVQAVELADLDRQQPLDLRRRRLERGPVDPHPDHRRPGLDPVVLRDGRQRLGVRGEVRGPRPDDVAQDRGDPVRVAHHEHRLGREAAVLHADRDDLAALASRPPTWSAGTRAPRGRRSRRRRTAGRARGTRAGGRGRSSRGRRGRAACRPPPSPSAVRRDRARRAAPRSPAMPPAGQPSPARARRAPRRTAPG